MSLRVRVVAILLAVVGLAVSDGVPAGASEPPSQKVTVTSEIGVKTYTWTGTVPPTPTAVVGEATAPCIGDPDLEDLHEIEIDLAARVYSNVVVEYSFQISWDDSGNDLALAVSGPQGAVGSSDGGDPVETVPAINVDEGTYVVNACAFAAAGATDYRGLLKVTTKSKRRPQPTTTTTTTRVTAGAPDGSGSSGSSGVPPAAPLPAAPTSRRPTPPARPSGAVASPVTEPSPLPPVEAAPPAFISSGIDPLESAAPPPAPIISKETRSLPLALALLVGVVGLVGLVVALFVRRRRGLDQVPGTGLVPVSS